MTGITKTRINATEPRSALVHAVEGQVEAASLVNKAYIRELHPNLFVSGGIAYYPFTASAAEETAAKYVDNLMLQLAFPLCYAFVIPILLLMINHDRITGFTERLRSSGLQMRNYWAANIFNSWITYITVFLLIYILGAIGI